MEHAFTNGELDAAVTYPPTSIKLMRDDKASLFFSTEEIPGEVENVITVEEDLIKQRPADVGKPLRALRRAVDYSISKPDEAYRIMATREGISPEEFADSLSNGIIIVTESEQYEYLKPAGKIAAVIDNTDHILRQSQQIRGPGRRANVTNASFSDSKLT